jgi:hypothetical protein
MGACIMGLFMDKLTGSEFGSAIAMILGLYGAADVAQDWVHGNKANVET